MPKIKKPTAPKTSIEKCEHCGKPASKKNKIQRGLCKQTCYNKWRRGTIKLKSGRRWAPKFPLLGEKKKMIKSKIKKTTIGNVYNEITNEATQPEIENKVTIDFTNYHELYQVIKKIGKLQYLPVNHAIINLIAAGVMWGEKKAAAESEI